MTSDIPKRRPLVAAIAASLLMLAFGLTYRVLAARLGGPVTAAPIAPAALEGLPMQIGDWLGQDVPVDEAVMERTGTDAHISRRYSRHSGSESVALYVACGVRVDEVMGHVPEGCYRAAGWALVGHHSVELPLGDGMKLPCSIFQCFRGALDSERLTVLHYFIVDGQYCSDISRLRSKVWRVLAMADYVAQVQLVTSAETLTADSATGVVSAFAVDSASSITRLFEELQTDRSTRELPKPLEGE